MESRLPLALLALTLSCGCNRISSPVEPLSSPTPTPTPSNVTLALWPVCQGSQPIWFVTNNGAILAPAGSWAIGTAVSGVLPSLTPGASVTLDHPTVILSGGTWTLTVTDAGNTFTSSIGCAPIS